MGVAYCSNAGFLTIHNLIKRVTQGISFHFFGSEVSKRFVPNQPHTVSIINKYSAISYHTEKEHKNVVGV